MLIILIQDRNILKICFMEIGRLRLRLGNSVQSRSMKIAMAIIEMLHARMFPAVWNEDLIRWQPGEKTDKPKVERINKLMDGG